MARRVPTCPTAPVASAKESGQWNRRTYSITLVTPLFGGGPTQGENDPVTLVRGPAIRGQLRFWWRATRGASIASPDELRRREGEIWGTGESPSPVTLWVSDVTGGKVERWANYEPNPKGGGVRSIPTPMDRNYPSYALFPFQGETKVQDHNRIVTKEPAIVTKNVSFKLNLQWPVDKDITTEVEAALWAWVNLGGLGARTRRGCGSLFCKELAPSNDDIRSLQKWYKNCLERYSIQTADSVRPWPTLPEELLVLCNSRGVQLVSPLEAWSKSVNTLQQFRQGLGIGRKKKNDNRPEGRSFWPEADSLRLMTGWSHPKHSQSITVHKEAFPRAELGLPIIFHFKDSPPRSDRGVAGFDPVDCRLLPAGGTDRMASPLILKALAVSPTQAVSIILQLKTVLPEGVAVKSSGFERTFGSDTIRRPDLTAYSHSPMSNRSQKGSALEAFMKFAGEEGFR